MSCQRHFIIYKYIILLLISSILLFMSGCNYAKEPITVQSYLLDTIVSITYYDKSDEEAIRNAISLCEQYEKVFSRTDHDSELYYLNMSNSMTVSDSLLTVINKSLEFCDITSGCFDITMGGVISLYSFNQTEPRRPNKEELAEALQHVGYSHVSVNDNIVTIDDENTIIDLGAIAKGYIADEMKNLMISEGVKHAIISLGGNILTIGSKPDGNPYAIGIQYPEKNSSKLATIIKVSDISVVTSGVYERYFIENDIIYHHILDSSSGEPIHNGLLAVSIVGPQSIVCDALSTACFALGIEDGMRLINNLDMYEAVFITEDHLLHCSDNFNDYVQP